MLSCTISDILYTSRQVLDYNKSRGGAATVQLLGSIVVQGQYNLLTRKEIVQEKE